MKQKSMSQTMYNQTNKNAAIMRQSIGRKMGNNPFNKQQVVNSKRVQQNSLGQTQPIISDQGKPMSKENTSNYTSIPFGQTIGANKNLENGGDFQQDQIEEGQQPTPKVVNGKRNSQSQVNKNKLVSPLSSQNQNKVGPLDLQQSSNQQQIAGVQNQQTFQQKYGEDFKIPELPAVLQANLNPMQMDAIDKSNSSTARLNKTIQSTFQTNSKIKQIIDEIYQKEKRYVKHYVRDDFIHAKSAIFNLKNFHNLKPQSGITNRNQNQFNSGQNQVHTTIVGQHPLAQINESSGQPMSLSATNDPSATNHQLMQQFIMEKQHQQQNSPSDLAKQAHGQGNNIVTTGIPNTQPPITGLERFNQVKALNNGHPTFVITNTLPQ